MASKKSQPRSDQETRLTVVETLNAGFSDILRRLEGKVDQAIAAIQSVVALENKQDTQEAAIKRAFDAIADLGRRTDEGLERLRDHMQAHQEAESLKRGTLSDRIETVSRDLAEWVNKAKGGWAILFVVGIVCYGLLSGFVVWTFNKTQDNSDRLLVLETQARAGKL